MIIGYWQKTTGKNTPDVLMSVYFHIDGNFVNILDYLRYNMTNTHL